VKQHWRLKTTFWLDIALLVSVCALMTVRFTGLVIHECLGLAVIGMVLAHLLFSWSWIVTQSRRLFTERPIRERINYIINFALLFSFTAALFFGILISQKAVPALTGAKVSPDNINLRWSNFHKMYAWLLLCLSGFHLAINWDWVLAATRNLFRRFRESAL
jgi:cytochrome b561